MTLKNVALVFGPTLMRSADDHMLLNMSATYSVVDLLCSHVSGCGMMRWVMWYKEWVWQRGGCDTRDTCGWLWVWHYVLLFL